MPATIADRLLITITDPLGRTTTLARSTFVAPDGTMAVNRGGGVVTGPGGVALRVPEGAIDGAATFRIAAVDDAATASTEETQTLSAARRPQYADNTCLDEAYGNGAEVTAV